MTSPVGRHSDSHPGSKPPSITRRTVADADRASPPSRPAMPLTPTATIVGYSRSRCDGGAQSDVGWANS